MDTGFISSVVGVTSLKRAATIWVLAEFELNLLDLLVTIYANISLALLMWFMHNLNEDKCIAHLWILKSTCRGGLYLSAKGAKTNYRFLWSVKTCV